jgi:transposase
MELTEKQWSRLEQIILQSVPKKDSRGRKPRDPREVLNGILWALRTGAPRKDLPDRCPPRQTCHRRFQQWVNAGIFRRIVEGLAADLQERGGLDIREAFIDGSFVPAKKGAAMWPAGRNGAKGAGSWQLRTLPVFLPPSVLQALRRMK